MVGGKPTDRGSSEIESAGASGHRDERSQDPQPARHVADLGRGLGVDAGVHESLEPYPLLVDHPERRVSRARQLGRRLASFRSRSSSESSELIAIPASMTSRRRSGSSTPGIIVRRARSLQLCSRRGLPLVEGHNAGVARCAGRSPRQCRCVGGPAWFRRRPTFAGIHRKSDGRFGRLRVVGRFPSITGPSPFRKSRTFRTDGLAEPCSIRPATCLGMPPAGFEPALPP